MNARSLSDSDHAQRAAKDASSADSVDPAPLAAFTGVGIELEYMIVQREALDVLPIADALLHAASGGSNDVARGTMGWSNEFVLHVIEIKNRVPVRDIAALPGAFQREVNAINALLVARGARLMPGAMHPWMRPDTETRLWPHDHAALYQTYARIFDCHTHGWANLQSMHVNLPFADDAQFARLHAALRLLLPLLPALAASSPLVEGRDSDHVDFRMETYRSNAAPFNTIAGAVIPESVASRAEYEARLLQPMYEEIAPHDPQQLLRHEWLNSRGAIARFDRHAIEVRVIDVQECPRADLAIAAALVACARNLFDAGARAATLRAQQQVPTESLRALLMRCIRDGEQARVEDVAYLKLLGLPATPCTAGQAWSQLLARHGHAVPAPLRPPLRTILDEGPLARRILRALENDFSAARMRDVYGALCECLAQGRLFHAYPAGLPSRATTDSLPRHAD